MDIQYQAIADKWLTEWEKRGTYEISNHSDRPKFYCLDMFPYPSGAGLHVGHPRGYIATDILSRYKRMHGFNVLHPMGFDAFGLPAEQYAIETGQHPEVTTRSNIDNFKKQLRQLGFCYDPGRELRTSDPLFYNWTQWIFLKLFESWYDPERNSARPLAELISLLESAGNGSIRSVQDEAPVISAAQWHGFNSVQRSEFLMQYRLAYRAESNVNWCPGLGTVLANDEVKDGYSERGGFPVEKKKMRQWMLRITAYGERLLNNLDQLDWPEALKEMQRNWIGKSLGCEIDFHVADREHCVSIFTTRPDTVYGCTFLVLAPEHPLTLQLSSPERLDAVQAYIDATRLRSERDRVANVNLVTGEFTGAYALHPLSGKRIPIWTGDYVLAEYGTGAIMAVPAADERDFRFANTFNLEIRQVFSEAQGLALPYERNSGTLIDAESYTGLTHEAAKLAMIDKLGGGRSAIKFRLRNAIFGRQRYWGEPIPIYYDSDGVPHAIPEAELPLQLPKIEAYLPTREGEPPLARASDWTYRGMPIDTTTMPGWAGSSWYFLRYMDPTNEGAFASRGSTDYWNMVDLYMGGAEHATGHLLYSRFWNHFLHDLGMLGFEEPFRKIVCQGMILGQSALIYRVKNSNRIVSADLKGSYDTHPLYVDVKFVDTHNCVDVAQLRTWRKEYAEADFELSGGSLLCERITEKMSKSKYNVVTPDDVISQHGADCFRLHEMFLGPIDQSAPWSIQTIDGSQKFLQRYWRLFYNNEEVLLVNNDAPSEPALKIIHQTIKKVSGMTERLSFNTAIAIMMSCVNQLGRLDVHNASVLRMLTQILHPYAPFITEELWHSALGQQGTILDHGYPQWDEVYLHEDDFEYPVSINGKLRTKIRMDIAVSEQEAKDTVLDDLVIQHWVQQRRIVKIVFIPNKIINIVLA